MKIKNIFDSTFTFCVFCLVLALGVLNIVISVGNNVDAFLASRNFDATAQQAEAAEYHNYTANLYEDGEVVIFVDGYKVFSTQVENSMELKRLQVNTTYPTYVEQVNGRSILLMIDEESGYAVANVELENRLDVEDHEFIMIKFMKR